MSTAIASLRKSQCGAAAVEFAIVSAAFFTLLIGIVEMGRMLFYWNTAMELTRMGARVAAVCDPNDPDIAAKIAAFYPLIPAANVSVTYTPGGCTVNSCQEVTVSVLPGISIINYIPFVPAAVRSLALPGFNTTIPRESMQSTFGGVANPVCS
jgi:Flp pilus assembly protein TadG